VIVPAIFEGPDDPELLDWITGQAAKGATIVSICLGAHVVANTGLMDGHRATSHFSSEERRAQTYPDVRWQKNTRWVADGKIVSSAGISAAVPISIALVEAIAGRDRASAVASALGVESWTSKHNSDAFEARPGEMSSAEPGMTLGIPLREGMDEISLGLTADAYMHSQQVAVRALASALEPVTTLSGLRVVPDLTESSSVKVDRVLSYVDVKPATHALDVALGDIADDYGRAASCRAARMMEHPSYERCR
jgi:transcriptional regulator GlxA family with amidase domain